jgi:hypothetical protein
MRLEKQYEPPTYNSFIICEAYVGSICSGKRSIDQTNGFPLRHSKVMRQERRSEDAVMRAFADQETCNSPLSTQTTFVKEFLPFHV